MKNVDKNETEELIERDLSYSALNKVVLVFIGVSIGFACHSVYSIIGYLTDRSIPIVVCPKSYVVDSPIIMKTIKNENDKITKDRWIRGFVRKFVLSQFPRIKGDVKPFFTYVVNHSSNRVKEKYQSLLKSESEVSQQVEAGYFYKFYPKFGLGSDSRSESDLRIRKKDGTGKWTVEIDGFLVKKMSNIAERYEPTLRYEIEIGKSTIDNPEGLYVTDANFEQITDYVSGTKESL